VRTRLGPYFYTDEPTARANCTDKPGYIIIYLLDDIYEAAVRINGCMSSLQSVTQRVSTALQRSSYLAATVAVVIAAASVGYGLTNNDLLTALGALLIVPSIVLLYEIGSRERSGEFDGTRRQTN